MSRRCSQNVQLMKEELQNRPLFNLSSAYELVKRTNKTGDEDQISIDEFHNMLTSHGVFALERDVKNLFERYDKDKDGKMSFKDFAGELLTVEQCEKVRQDCIFPHKQFTKKELELNPPFY